MNPILEQIVKSVNYGDLPESWQVPRIDHFSAEKTLYDYQRSALQNAARALFLYYQEKHDWQVIEPQAMNNERKRYLMGLYQGQMFPPVSRYETSPDRKNGRQNRIFRILSDYIEPIEDSISYDHLINRMCFWMATGSGKTLVMIKLIEYLYFLQQRGEVPNHRILMLAPSEYLLEQIQRTIKEFNQSCHDLFINFVSLRSNGQHQGQLGNSITVYYYRSDNIADVRKDLLTNYRDYENDGKWFIFLDEAHKGSKIDSKRQAYYSIMARNGFLFNFSATFTDREDIITTVKKYNLEEFIRDGYGKSIYLNEKEYYAFKNRQEQISPEERQKIVLKSLITLACVSMRVDELRKETKIEKLYHAPLMLTLVNSVNTDIEKKQNDLWAFFETLRSIASGEIDEKLFENSKREIIEDWNNAGFLFEESGGRTINGNEAGITEMTVTNLRRAVFLSAKKGALQFIRSSARKEELALQIKNAASPFALIRIGDTSKWRKIFLDKYEETTTLQDKSFFDNLEQNPMTILMGSRSFFESWDSNRPNVINFINIGGIDAKKFVVQSAGRGVRIEMLPNKRRRLHALLRSSLLEDREKKVLTKQFNRVQLPETLFLFATNRNSVKSVLEGLANEKTGGFENLKGIEIAPKPKINGSFMPLLLPLYKDIQVDGCNNRSQAEFAMSKKTLGRFSSWLKQTSDATLIVRDGLTISQIAKLRAAVNQPVGVRLNPKKNYAQLSFLQDRFLSYLSKTTQKMAGIKEIETEDIVHFSHICVHKNYIDKMQEKVHLVAVGEVPNEVLLKLIERFKKGKITREDFNQEVAKKNIEEYEGMKISKFLGHYYLPMLINHEQTNHIQHAINIRSEIKFLDLLESWMKDEKDKLPWDFWMFSKIDETLDKIYIPYFDSFVNEYRRFVPDFIFWMCQGNDYRIVFVDPKGMTHVNAYDKINGYIDLFGKKERKFKFSHWNISIKLLMFNPSCKKALPKYREYWTDTPSDIFAGL